MNTKVGYLAKFDYEVMVQNALRSVVREALRHVEKSGLPGNHHFYITFETNRPDVKIPDFLRQKHPEEVTIVLQHQFWDLKIDDKGFGVNLSFNDAQEAIYVPYTAIISFLDPSVKFGLQFVPDKFLSTGPGSSPQSPDLNTKKNGDTPTPSKTDNVVTLDNFRKK
jgi:uncharacterized protein